MPPTLTLLATLLASAAAIGPRVASQEEILEMVDEWLYNFDEDEDGKLNLAEFGPLITMMREQSATPQSDTGMLTPQVLMPQADADKDGHANRAELIDLLKRMKGFDAGHLAREEANVPGRVKPAGADTYGESHGERMKAKKKKKKKPSKKDEV